MTKKEFIDKNMSIAIHLVNSLSPHGYRKKFTELLDKYESNKVDPLNNPYLDSNIDEKYKRMCDALEAIRKVYFWVNEIENNPKSPYYGGNDKPKSDPVIEFKSVDEEMKKFKAEIITEIDRMLDNLNLRKRALIGMRELSLSNEAQIFSYNNIKSLILSK